jgi:hypothetical protein
LSFSWCVPHNVPRKALFWKLVHSSVRNLISTMVRRQHSYLRYFSYFDACGYGESLL